MKKILNITQAIKISEDLKHEGKSIVLVGGCFDIIHVGHIAFLEQAEKQGEVLFIMLESDGTVYKLKGDQRPINTQEERAKILAALGMVDYVILLPQITTDEEYDTLVINIKPDIIATTKGDPYRKHKERQAALSGSKVVDVISKVPDTSTSKLAKILSKRGLL